MGNFFDMIFDYEKRRKMREHPIFKKASEMFPLTGDNIGNSHYMLLQAHYNATRDNNLTVVKMGDWVKYYFASGKKRDLSDNSYQSKQYFGRTEDELMLLSEKFMAKANKEGFNIAIQGAANIIYIKAIDEPYDSYMRCCNIMFRLRTKHPDMNFQLTTPLDNESYSVDIMAKKGNAAKGITVLPLDKFGADKETEYKQKHEIFKTIWGYDVLFIYSDINGKTAAPLPEFREIS